MWHHLSYSHSTGVVHLREKMIVAQSDRKKIRGHLMTARAEHAMCCGQHPLFVQQNAATRMSLKFAALTAFTQQESRTVKG
jgi:hypothetical protein